MFPPYQNTSPVINLVHCLASSLQHIFWALLSESQVSIDEIDCWGGRRIRLGNVFHYSVSFEYSWIKKEIILPQKDRREWWLSFDYHFYFVGVLAGEEKQANLAEDGFDPSTSGLWAQHAPAAPLCWRTLASRGLFPMRNIVTYVPLGVRIPSDMFLK